MEAFWQRFEDDYLRRVRRVRGRREAIKCSGSMKLSELPRENERMLVQVLSGRRRARIDTLENLQKHERKIMGSREYYILVGSDGTPRAVILTTGAHFIPYRRMEAEVALMEGVDDTLEAWRARWRRTLSYAAQEKGVPMSLETLMVAETFTVVYQE